MCKKKRRSLVPASLVSRIDKLCLLCSGCFVCQSVAAYGNVYAAENGCLSLDDCHILLCCAEKMLIIKNCQGNKDGNRHIKRI